ncbi:MAG TPA: F0F1 ATP synthase subunit A [Thermoleophilaceae bacterium]|nr:F0F1 ATP synthase subunit A [Thermoleophilaceae bacterium]
MSAASATAQAAPPEKKGGMSTRTKVWLSLAVMLGLLLAMVGIFGSEGENEGFKPQNEFKLESWIHIEIFGIDMSITKAVLYLALASAATVFTMVWIARRMEAKPNRVQTAVEAAYDLTRSNITGGNMDAKMALKWFPFVSTLFFFIWFSNMIGYLPLPTGTEHKVDVFGLEIPAFVLYAATANLSVPLMLTLMVWVSYHVEGVRAKGPIGYLKSWVPAGVEGAAAGPIFVIEVISHFVRIISLSVRLFANILAGHLLILFMGGGLVVLLGLAAAGVLTLPMAIAFYIFEVGLVATLQAFIFATLTSIYLGGATADHH